MIWLLFGELIIKCKLLFLLNIIIGDIELCGCLFVLMWLVKGLLFFVGDKVKFVSWLFKIYLFIIIVELNVILIELVIEIVLFWLLIIDIWVVEGSL